MFFGQDSFPLKISVFKSSEYSGIHTLGKSKMITFQITNISEKNVIVYGESDEDGFEPAIEILKFNNKEQKWLYSNDKEDSPNLDYVIEDKAKEKNLKPSKSINFTVSLGYNCLEKKYKIAVYIKSKELRKPSVILSDEFSLLDNSIGCSNFKRTNSF